MKPRKSCPGVVLAAALAACGGSSSDPAPRKVSVATAAAGGLTVELLTDTRLETGLTPVYLRVTDAAARPVTDATVTFTPLMTMTGGMNHGAPVIGEPALVPGDLYHVDVVFQMATSDMGSWSATVSVALPSAVPVEVAFPALGVADSGRAKTFLYTDPVTSAQTKYVASMNLASAPKVGLNPVLVTLHRKDSAMSFPPVTDAEVVLDPQMPSMGHGASGSVNPTPTTLGMYEGQVAFNMAGEWVTTITFAEGGVTLGAPAFTTNF